jgi:hypothetical protein
MLLAVDSNEMPYAREARWPGRVFDEHQSKISTAKRVSRLSVEEKLRSTHRSEIMPQMVSQDVGCPSKDMCTHPHICANAQRSMYV